MEITTIITYVLTGMGLLSAFLTLIILFMLIWAIKWFIRKTKLQAKRLRRREVRE